MLSCIETSCLPLSRNRPCIVFQTKTFDFRHHISDLVPVFQKVYKAIYCINHYPVDNAIGFANTYPLESDLAGR